MRNRILYLLLVCLLLPTTPCQATIRIKLAIVCNKGSEGVWKLEPFQHNQNYIDKLTGHYHIPIASKTYLVKIKRSRFLGPKPQLNWKDDIMGIASPAFTVPKPDPITAITKFGDIIIGKEWRNIEILRAIIRFDMAPDGTLFDEMVIIEFID